MLSISSNLMNLLLSQFVTLKIKDDYDFKQVGYAISLIYSYLLFFPATFIGMNKLLGVTIPLFTGICVFGYSLAPFLFSCALNAIVQFSFIRLLSIFAAGAHSTLFLLKNFAQFLETSEGNAQKASFILVIASQILLSILIYNHFF